MPRASTKSVPVRAAAGTAAVGAAAMDLDDDFTGGADELTPGSEDLGLEGDVPDMGGDLDEDL
jgi:hypothetical protein